MTIKVKQVLNKVRELAWAKPEHIYRKVGRGDACSYVGPGVGQPIEPEAGCIMGQAMVACGVSAETLFEIENFKGAMSFGELIPNYGNVLDVERPNYDRGYHAYLRFADNVQQYQDEGKPWGEAYREAMIEHVATRHEYEAWDFSPPRCRECSKKEDALEHRGRIQVGDIVEHTESEVLDPRMVVKVVDGMIWLDVPGTEVIGPFPAENYRVIDIDWEVVVDG